MFVLKKMAPKFKDIGKSGSDLLSNDYCFDRKFKLKTKTTNGLELTTEGTLKGKGSTSGKLTAKFSPFEGITIKKLCVNTEGRFSTEATLNNAYEGVTFTCKAEDGGEKPPAGELTVDYSCSSGNASLSVDVTDVNGPTLYGNAVVAYEQFLLGGEVKYCTGFDSSQSGNLADHNFGLSYLGGDFEVSLKTKSKCTKPQLLLHSRVNDTTCVSTNYCHSSKCLTVGGSYVLDKSTSFTGKINSSGIVSANAIQKVSPGVKLISSVSVDAKNFAADSHKFGLQLILG